MSSLTAWIGLISTIVGVATILGAGLVILRGSYTKARLELLRGAVEDYKAEKERLEQEISKLEIRISACENENRILKGIVTAKAEISALQDVIMQNHEQLMDALESAARSLPGGGSING